MCATIPTTDFPPAPARPCRTVRLRFWDAGSGRGMLTITEKGKAEDYLFEPAPSEIGGEGWLMLKAGDPSAEIYCVLLARAGFDECHCKGHLRWKHCRHVEVLKALKRAGKL